MDKCVECKSWVPIGNYIGTLDEWEQSKDSRGSKKGWCTKNPPGSGSSKWPETLEHQSCGSYEDKVTPLEAAMNSIRDANERWKMQWIKARKMYLKIVHLNKAIRATGEEFGISRKKRPERILFLMSQKYFVLRQLEKKEKENDK